MYCSKCGKKIGDNKEKYCKKCGSSLTETKTALSKTEKKNEQTSPAPAQKQKSSCCLKLFFGILGLILLFTLIGIFAGAGHKFLDSIKTNTSATPTKEKTKTPTPASNTNQDSSNNDQDDSLTPAPEETQTPEPAPKQMYYWVGCGDCQNPSCQESYHYAGYNEGEWLLNKTWCESCTCNDLKARSYYR